MGVTGDTTRPRSRPVDVELAGAGLSPRAARHRVRAGRLHRVHPGVFAVGHPVLGADGRRLAAVLACGPGAVLSHRSAAAAWGLRPTSRPRHEVTVPRTAGTGPAVVEAHRARRLSPDDVTVLRAVPIPSVARTLVDLAGVRAAHARERAVHEAEVRRLLDVRALDAAMARAPNRRGVGTLRAVLAEPDPGSTHAGLEERFLALCRRTGLPPPRCNVAVPLGDRLLEVDALWSRERVVSSSTAGAFTTPRRRSRPTGAATPPSSRAATSSCASRGSASSVSRLRSFATCERSWPFAGRPRARARAGRRASPAGGRRRRPPSGGRGAGPGAGGRRRAGAPRRRRRSSRRRPRARPACGRA
jgi:hypothetical protein